MDMDWRSSEDSDLANQILRMENKKIGGVLADICKLLRNSGVEKKYFDEADLNTIPHITEFFGTNISEWSELRLRLETYRTSKSETLLDLLKKAEKKY